ncbi:MAG: hypothetical protein H6R26_3324 [Proteobacteria bacterium]|nr:hypothetical protein [Pseudomonadota bacterium]
MRAKTESVILLTIFMILDILPIPVLALVLLYVIFTRPPWFRSLVNRLYHEG